MKRVGWKGRGIFVILLLIGLFSCGEDAADALWYQEQECVFTGVCRLEDGEYTVKIYLHTDGSRELAFLAPETLAGCRYVRDSAGAYSFICEDAVLPVAANPTAETIFGLFALEPTELQSASLSKNAGEGLNLLEFAGGITVYLSSVDGLPLRFEHPLLKLTLYADKSEVLPSE